MGRSRRPSRDTRSARLTPRGTTLVTVGAIGIVGAYVLGRQELLYVGSLAALLPLLAVAFARFRRVSVEVTRSFMPGMVAVGNPTTVELLVSNTAPVPTPELTWRDGKPWASGGTRSRTLPPLTARRSRTILPGNSARLRYDLIAPRRGVFEIGPMSVVLADPFGLATGQVSVGGTDSLVVTPSVTVLPGTGLAILASEGTSMLVRRAIGSEDDLSTREYRTGDALRRVHWRATARHGELMVRQEEPRSHAEARVILDTRRGGYADYLPPGHRDDVESESFELAISLASSIAVHLARDGFEVEFVETGDRQLDPVVPFELFLESLATIELSVDEGELPPGSVLRASSRPDRAHGSVFAILSDADTQTIERVAAQRASFDLAVAFVIARRDSRSLEDLREAGWTCVPMRLDDTVDGAWRAVAEAYGARRGR